MNNNFEVLLNLDKSNPYEYEFNRLFMPRAEYLFNELLNISEECSFKKLFKKDKNKIALFVLKIAIMISTYNFGSRLEEKKLAHRLKYFLDKAINDFKIETSSFRRNKKFENSVYESIKFELNTTLKGLIEIQKKLNPSIDSIEKLLKSDFGKSDKRTLDTLGKVKSDFILEAIQISRSIYNKPNLGLIEDLFKTPYIINKLGSANFESISKLSKRQNRDSSS